MASEELEERPTRAHAPPQSHRGTRTLLAAALLGGGATVLVTLLGVARTKVLAVELEPSGLGLYGQVFSIVSTVTVAAGLGLGLGTTRVVAEARARHDLRRMEVALTSALAIPAVLALVLGVGVAGLSPLLAPALLGEDRVLFVVLAAVTVPIAALQGPLFHALQGFRDVAGAQGAHVAFGMVLTVATAVGVVAAGLTGAVVALPIASAAFVAILYLRVRSLAESEGLSLYLRRGFERRLLGEPVVRTMLAIGFASLLAGLVGGVTEIVIRSLVLHERGSEEAGIWQSLMLLSMYGLLALVTGITFMSFTTIAEANARGDRQSVRSLIDKALRLALLIELPLMLALGLFREDLVRVFLSAEFAQTAALIPDLLVGTLLHLVSLVLAVALVPLGLTRRWLVIALITSAFWMAGAVALIPPYGVRGAVVAYIVFGATGIMLNVAVLVAARAITFSARTVLALVCGGVFLAMVYADLGGVASRGAMLGAGTLVLILLGTTRDEWRTLAAGARGVFKPRLA